MTKNSEKSFDINNIEKEFKDKVYQAQDKNRENKADVFMEHDLAIGVMNLIEAELHLFFTGAKTGKTEYYDMINDVREIRKEMMKKIITKYEGEIWCTCKHLLTSSIRLMEVGTKQQTLGNNEAAYDFFRKSYDLYMNFWVLVAKQDDSANPEKIGFEDFYEKINSSKAEIGEAKIGKILERHTPDKKIDEKNNAFYQSPSNGNDNNRSGDSFVKNQEADGGKRPSSFGKFKDFISKKLDCCRE